MPTTRAIHARPDFDELMRHLTIVGFAALATWVVVGIVAAYTGILEVAPEATARFLLAVMILVFARRAYWEIREWRYSKLPADERFGFANPLAEHGRTTEDHHPDDAGSSQTQG